MARRTDPMLPFPYFRAFSLHSRTFACATGLFCTVSSIIRIGNAQGFWGDDGDAPARLVAQQSDLDILTLDYLAEVSLSIMALQRHRDPEAGYARDVVGVVQSLVPHWKAGHPVTLVTNAGGLNPEACARACKAALAEAGLPDFPVGIVDGDDALPTIKEAAADPVLAEHLRNWDTNEPIATVLDKLDTANAYIGAKAVAECLAQGARIVITGRVADPSLAVGPCMHRFGWSETDYDRLAGATVAGHLIECGTQVCGGISTDWLGVPDPAHIGFPVVEVDENGQCVVTKPVGTGGRVTERTVIEQLLYELGDPDCYRSPDATVRFTDIVVTQEGVDRVRVAGAVGSAPTDFYKVSATFREGYRASGTLTLFGRDALAKAERSAGIIRTRLREAGAEPERFLAEYLGNGACAPGVLDLNPDTLETVMRISVADPDKAVCERFARSLAALVTAGAQGTTGYAGGRPRVTPVFGYWPCLIPRDRIAPRAAIVEG